MFEVRATQAALDPHATKLQAIVTIKQSTYALDVCYECSKGNCSLNSEQFILFTEV